jgi:hypothetical protein
LRRVLEARPKAHPGIRFNEFIVSIQNTDVDIGLRYGPKSSALPNNPAIRFARGTVFAATLVRNCYGLFSRSMTFHCRLTARRLAANVGAMNGSRRNWESCSLESNSATNKRYDEF